MAMLYGAINPLAFGIITASAFVALLVALFCYFEILQILIINKCLVWIAQSLLNHSSFCIHIARKRFHFLFINRLFAYNAQKSILLSQKLMKYIQKSTKRL